MDKAHSTETDEGGIRELENAAEEFTKDAQEIEKKRLEVENKRCEKYAKSLTHSKGRRARGKPLFEGMVADIFSSLMYTVRYLIPEMRNATMQIK